MGVPASLAVLGGGRAAITSQRITITTRSGKVATGFRGAYKNAQVPVRVKPFKNAARFRCYAASPVLACVRSSKHSRQRSEAKAAHETMSGASSSMERPDLGRGQRRRRPPSAVEARAGSGDGARSSGRSTATTATTSSCWSILQGRGQCPPTYKPPYMDVQTVKTNLTVDQAAGLEGQSHCLLLVEPVLLPDLGHTGVTREALPGDRPLFYPNGCKNRGLGAIVRNSLYHSASAPRLTADSSKAFDRRQQQTTTPSDWAARRGPLSSRGSSLAENCTETPASDIPAGQCETLSLPPDTWENPRVAGAEGCRRKPRGAATTSSRGAADKRMMAKHGRAEQRGGRAAAKGFLAERAAGANRARLQKQQQQQQQQPLQRSSSNFPPGDPKHSASTSGTITAPISDCFDYDRTGPAGLDAAGRDSEWVAERRAADAEARELLGALKRNSSRLWFLVGGGV